ncbi:MAG: glycosyltransferase family 4 protein [Flavobacteriales bacterium]
MKKVLIITYYWPPMGGGGVQRWLKFVKYLREYGWEPVVFTTEGGNISIRDESLYRDIPEDVEVIRHPIREPYGIYNRLMGKKKDEGFHAGFVEKEKQEGPSLMKRFTMWVRGALFIPDAKMLWIGPASRRIKKILRTRSFDAMVSTGPPHTTHIIADKVKRKHSELPWLADFRDPWTEIDFFHHLPMPKWAEKRHKKLEKRVLQRADQVVTVSWSWAKDLGRIGAREVEVITNGYDEADLPSKGSVPLTESFSITHAGAFNKDRNPPALWEAMGEVAEEEEGFRASLQIRSIGPTDHVVREGVEKAGLIEDLTLIDQLPHKEVIPYLCASWVLLLPLNDTPNINGVVPGKLYEYLGVRRPILCTGKADGDAAWIVENSNAGVALDIDDRQGIKEALRTYFQGYRQGRLEVDSGSIEAYSRRTLTGGISRLLDGMIS